jgi:hypothetical protein
MHDYDYQKNNQVPDLYIQSQFSIFLKKSNNLLENCQGFVSSFMKPGSSLNLIFSNTRPTLVWSAKKM